jgi:FHS family L-fucose permease-like MFS transporter
MTQKSMESASPEQKTGFAMAVAATVFFLFGFATSLNGVLQPHLKAIFNLNYGQATLVQSAWFSAYLVLSMPAAALMAKLGYQKAMVLGLGVMGFGALLFYPAAGHLSYGVFLSAIFVLAAGVTMLQVAANPFVTLLGSQARASSRLNLAQAFNSVGQMLAPSVGGWLFLSGVAITAAMSETARTTAAQAVKAPYLAMAIVLLVLALVLSQLKLNLPMELSSARPETGDSLWKHRHLVLGAVAMFAYVGAEICITSLFVNYLTQPEIGNLTPKSAAPYLSLLWFGMIVGRLAGTVVMRTVPGGKVLGWAGTFALALTITTMMTTGAVAVGSIVLLGLAESIMFPTIFALAVTNLGTLTAKGSGMINVAIVGGAVMPPIQGMLADAIGLHVSYIVPGLCYVFVLYYGFIGSKIRATEGIAS